MLSVILCGFSLSCDSFFLTSSSNNNFHTCLFLSISESRFYERIFPRRRSKVCVLVTVGEFGAALLG